MTLRIENERTESLAWELAEITGETLTEAVTLALQERLERERVRSLPRPGIGERLRQLAAEVASLPVLDERTPEERAGFDEHGLPK